MSNKPLRIVLACVLFCTPAAAQYEAQLFAAFVNHLLVLRDNYTDAHLVFDTNGKLVSHATPGFGPNEGRLYVDRMMIEPGKLTILGNRPVDIYDENKKALQPVNIGRQVVVEIELPSSEPAERAVPKLLEVVFFKAIELDKMKCSADEERRFYEGLQKSREINPASAPKKKAPVPEAQSLDELQASCYPIGDRAYPVGKGIRPPKAIKTPNEKFYFAARSANKSGILGLMMIVDAKGKPTSLIVSHPLGSGLDEEAIKAVSTWTFSPATFQGKPVAVAVRLEMKTQ